MSVYYLFHLKFEVSELDSEISGLYFQPPMTIINSKKIIVLIIKPTGM